MNNTGTFSSKLRKTQHFVNVIASDCWRIIPTVWHLNLNSNQWYFYLISMAHLDDKLNFYSNSKIFQNVVNLSVWGLERWKCQYFHSSKTDLGSEAFLSGQKRPSIRFGANSVQKYLNYIDKWREMTAKRGNFCTDILLAQYLREILHISWQQNGTFEHFNEDFCWEMSSFKLYN